MDKQRKEIEELKAQLTGMAERLKELTLDTADSAKEEANGSLDAAEDWIKDTVGHLQDAGKAAKKRASSLSKQAADYVEENPWQVAAVAAAVAGTVVGIMMMNRKKE